jgi:hypothetical protein
VFTDEKKLRIKFRQGQQLAIQFNAALLVHTYTPAYTEQGFSEL